MTQNWNQNHQHASKTKLDYRHPQMLQQLQEHKEHIKTTWKKS